MKKSFFLSAFLCCVLSGTSLCKELSTSSFKIALASQKKSKGGAVYTGRSADDIALALSGKPEWSSLFDDFVSLQIMLQSKDPLSSIRPFASGLIKRIQFMQKYENDPILEEIIAWCRAQDGLVRRPLAAWKKGVIAAVITVAAGAAMYSLFKARQRRRALYDPWAHAGVVGGDRGLVVGIQGVELVPDDYRGLPPEEMTIVNIDGRDYFVPIQAPVNRCGNEQVAMLRNSPCLDGQYLIAWKKDITKNHDCSICLEVPSGDSYVCLDPQDRHTILHEFCKKCLEGWFGQGQGTCPICRASLSDGCFRKCVMVSPVRSIPYEQVAASVAPMPLMPGEPVELDTMPGWSFAAFHRGAGAGGLNPLVPMAPTPPVAVIPRAGVEAGFGPVVVAAGELKPKGDTDCNMCIGNEGLDVFCEQCKTPFHLQCISEWINQYHTCPAGCGRPAGTAEHPLLSIPVVSPVVARTFASGPAAGVVGRVSGLNIRRGELCFSEAQDLTGQDKINKLIDAGVAGHVEAARQVAEHFENYKNSHGKLIEPGMASFWRARYDKLRRK